MSTPAVSLVDVSSYLPKNRVTADYFTRFADPEEVTSNAMFKAPPFRHHIAPGETPADMVEHAIAPLLERHGPLIRGEDLVRYIGLESSNALRMAAQRGSLGFPVLKIPGRRGRFARTRDVADWLASMDIKEI